MGILITIEANDGSGKETQSKRLVEHLEADGYEVKRVTYPNYDSDSSALVKMYLNGEFSESADGVSPYAASVLFAVDRYASFMREWKAFYDAGGIVIADRYTTANMMHQASKLEDPQQITQFLDWLVDFEYRIMGIPEPDMTFFLDVPVAHSIKVIEARANKIDGSATKDIHERDHEHLKRAYRASLFVGERYNWQRIISMEDDQFRPIEEIHDEIYRHVKEFIDER